MAVLSIEEEAFLHAKTVYDNMVKFVPFYYRKDFPENTMLREIAKGLIQFKESQKLKDV